MYTCIYTYTSSLTTGFSQKRSRGSYFQQDLTDNEKYVVF